MASITRKKTILKIAIFYAKRELFFHMLNGMDENFSKMYNISYIAIKLMKYVEMWFKTLISKGIIKSKSYDKSVKFYK